MEKNKLNIPNITCGHCVMAVKNELLEMDGVSSVEGNPETKDVEVTWDAPATLETIKAKLQEINYPAA
jgi:copper chaperone